jgi:hypothetical protein
LPSYLEELESRLSAMNKPSRFPDERIVVEIQHIVERIILLCVDYHLSWYDIRGMAETHLEEIGIDKGSLLFGEPFEEDEKEEPEPPPKPVPKQETKPVAAKPTDPDTTTFTPLRTRVSTTQSDQRPNHLLDDLFMQPAPPRGKP